DTVEVDTTTTADTQVVASVGEDNNQKILKESKTVKNDENDPVLVTTSTQFDDLFDDVSTNIHQIKSEYTGKTIKINTDITKNEQSYIINIPITLTSDNNNTIDLNTSNGYENTIIPHWTSINFTSGASGSRISNMQFYNTQIFVKGANDIEFYNNTLNGGASFLCGNYSIVEGNTISGAATISGNSQVTNNIFKSDVTLKNNVNFKNNNAENSTVYVIGANCYLCNNTINKLIVNDATYNTYICSDNHINEIEGNEDNVVYVDHPSLLNFNKKLSRTIKTEGEPTYVDITEENFLNYFKVNSSGKASAIKNSFTEETILNVYSIPSNVTTIEFPSLNKVQYPVSIVGKNDLTLRNIRFNLLNENMLLTNLTLIYDEDYADNYNNPRIMLGHTSPDGISNSVVLDNVTINATFSYENSGKTLITTKHISNDSRSNIVIKNSKIDVNAPSTSESCLLIAIKTYNVVFMNNTININEIYGSGDNPSLIGFSATDSVENILFEINNITMTGTEEGGNLYAFKMDTKGTHIKNHTITITSDTAAIAVELTGNDNIVTENCILANDKTGNDAVIATGENNIVENNTAPEMDTRIPTNIELNYDGMPIDVDQRLIIRGVFKAKNQEATAEGINIYDNDELIASVNTSDEFGSIAYAYTPTTSGTHKIKFSFDGNDTHQATSTIINVTVKGDELSPIVNITTDNFYDYFDAEGELNTSKLVNDTTFYFFSIPDGVTQLSLTKSDKNTTGRNITFAGTEDFILTNTAIIVENNLNNFRLVNMTIVYNDDYELQDYILLQKDTGTNESYVDNCNITANITRQQPRGYPYSVISTANAPAIISNSQIVANILESEVDWNPESSNYGNTNVIPIKLYTKTTLVNNTIKIFGEVDGTSYPTLYAIRLGGHETLMTQNNITVNGGGWLYAIQPVSNNIEVSNNHINITGINYTAGIMIENRNNITIDNNTIILNANTSREGMLNEPCTYGITIIDYNYMGGTATETGNAANNKITNNNITCTAYNMYGIEEFGGSNNTIENNSITATGDTAMTIGVIGINIKINNNNLIANGTSFSGSTVDYLGARTAGVYVARGYNVTVSDNNINSTYAGIYTQSQNILEINNNITTDYEYTVLLDSTTQNTTVENNYLVTPGRLGDESVNNTQANNIVQNNQPENEKEYSLKVDTTEFTVGQTTSITASIYYGTEYTQEIATNINKGKVTFKVDGKTLKDANGKVIYAKVVNGTATIENYEVPESWKEGSSIQAVYSGSSDLEKMSSEKTEITITSTEPTITTEDITTTVEGTITLTATINTGTTVNTGKVVFKINGKTVKDVNGKVIYTKVTNNTVNVTYTLPESYKEGTYNITAVFISPDYERLEDTKTLTVTA
ncbi:MAG: hypothetical protein Q4Q22_05960, partial [Methanosphaera sp.]|nr:hypothetical protein [Methanosphaera sp.]